MRCISGTLCFTLFVLAIKYLPLSIFFVVMNICPFLMALLACLWLREKITAVEVICMIGAFGGILIVGYSKQAESGEEDIEAMENYYFGLLCAFVACCGQAFSVVATRRLQDLSVFVIQWYYAVSSTLATGILVWL